MPRAHSKPARASREHSSAGIVRVVMAIGLLVLALGAEPSSLEVPEPPHPAAYELEWDAPGGCPVSEEIQAAVQGLLSAVPGGEGVMRVHAKVAMQPPRWRLRLHTEFGGKSDTREVFATSCGELGDSVALVIAASLDPTLQAAQTSSAPKEPVEPTPAPTPNRPKPKPRSEAQPTSTQPPPSRGVAQTLPHIRLRVDTGPEWGALESLVGTVGASATAHWKPARAELSARWVGLDTHAGPPGTRVAVQIFLASARGCAHLRTGRWEFPLCAGLEVGGVRIARSGFVQSDRLVGRWLAPTLAGALNYRFGALALWFEAQVAVRALGTRVRSGEAQVFSPVGAVSLRPLVGVEFVLP